MGATRRTVMMGLTATSLSAASLIGFPAAARDSSEFITATATVVDGLILGSASVFDTLGAFIDKKKKSNVRASKRAALRIQIDALANSLDPIISAKGVFLGDVKDYAASVTRVGYTPATHDRWWADIQRNVSDLINLVREPIDVLDRSPDLRKALSQKKITELRDLMAARSERLAAFSRLEAPRTPEELDRLGRIADAHQVLLDKTNALRDSLQKASSRLA